MGKNELAFDGMTQSSRIDTFVAWIDRLPVPAWIFYLFAAVGIAVINHLVFWLDGSLPVGKMNIGLARLAIIIVYLPALYSYLGQAGSHALKVFRPLLDTDEAGYTRLENELRSLPKKLDLPIFLAVLVSLFLPLSDLIFKIGLAGQTALGVVWLNLGIAWIGIMLAALTIRSLRQLRLVDQLHERATNIDLLDLGPTQGFSVLTARTGTGLILLLLINLFLGPIEFNLINLLDYGLIASVAVAIFIVPLTKMHVQIELRKSKALAETNGLLQIANDRLHTMIHKEEYDDLAATNTAIAALMREREFIQKISTWPWNTGTIRGFASTLLLPIFLWLVTRLLERVF